LDEAVTDEGDWPSCSFHCRQASSPSRLWIHPKSHSIHWASSRCALA